MSLNWHFEDDHCLAFWLTELYYNQGNSNNNNNDNDDHDYKNNANNETLTHKLSLALATLITIQPLNTK